MKSHRNRLANVGNMYQNILEHKRVLCVCSAGLLRSPTAALVLSQEPYNFNTRSVGLSQEYALILLDDALLHWADEVVVMEPGQAADVKIILADLKLDKPVVCLNIEDSFAYRDPKLVDLIRANYKESHTQ